MVLGSKHHAGVCGCGTRAWAQVGPGEGLRTMKGSHKLILSTVHNVEPQQNMKSDMDTGVYIYICICMHICLSQLEQNTKHDSAMSFHSGL